MRISDWSSDVCSSDLLCAHISLATIRRDQEIAARHAIGAQSQIQHSPDARVDAGAVLDLESGRDATTGLQPEHVDQADRSDERRAGKECGSSCRSRWWPYHLKKKKNTYKNKTI